MFFSSAARSTATPRPAQPGGDPPAPIGWYGVCKTSAEGIVREFGVRYGLSYTIFRLSNPYGFAAAEHRPQGVIPMLINAARRGEAFTVWGDGQAQKDFLFHADMSAAVGAALERRLQGTSTSAAGRSHSVAEIIGIIERQTGHKLDLRYAPAEAYPWDVTHSWLDNARLCAALGCSRACVWRRGRVADGRGAGGRGLSFTRVFGKRGCGRPGGFPRRPSGRSPLQLRRPGVTPGGEGRRAVARREAAVVQHDDPTRTHGARTVFPVLPGHVVVVVAVDVDHVPRTRGKERAGRVIRRIRLEQGRERRGKPRVVFQRVFS